MRSQSSSSGLDRVIRTSEEDVLPQLLDSSQSLVETGGLANPGLGQSSHEPGHHELRQRATAKINEWHLNIDGNTVVENFHHSSHDDLGHSIEELFRQFNLSEPLGTNGLGRDFKSQSQASNFFASSVRFIS